MGKVTSINDRIAAVRTAKDKANRSTAISKLAVAAHQSSEVLAAFRAVSAMPDGQALSLELAARMPLPLPPGIVLFAAPLLSEKKLPLPMRILAAAHMIASLPDRSESVGPVLRSVTAGCGPTRALDIMIRVQSKVPGQTDALDRAVTEAEKTTKHRCPKCRSRMTRSVLARHLWKKHRILFDGGELHDAGRHVEDAVGAAAKSATADGLDRVYLWADRMYPGVQPAQVHQAILSRLGAMPDELEPLKAAAREQVAGLCPGCHAIVPLSVPPLPPPLFVGRGRLSGNGYHVAVTRGAVGRVVRVTAPSGEVLANGGDGGPRLSARGLATWLLTPFAVVSFIVALSVSPRDAIPGVFLVLIAGMAAYGAGRLIRRQLPHPNDRAIDAAWREIAPRVGRKPAAARFLVRLCRTSLGRGTSEERTRDVWELADHAEVLADKGGVHLQLLAAARVLQASDAAALGKDFVSVLLPAFDSFVRGQTAPGYADALAELLLLSDTVPDRDTARLRVLIAVAAFDAGLTPTNLETLGQAAPAFGRLIGGPPDWLRLLFAVWRARHTRQWEDVAEADPVYEFAKKAPTASGRVLAQAPDTLLVGRFEKAIDDEIGAVLIGRRGVSVAGVTVADPEADVSVAAARNGGGVLVFGIHRIATKRKLPERVAATLRAWLRFRAEKLVPLGERPEGPGVADRVTQLALRASVECPLCGTRCVPQLGEVGVRIG